jgi:hypothetical protein
MFQFIVVAWDPEDLSGEPDGWITYLGECEQWDDPTGDVVIATTNGTPHCSNKSLTFDQGDEACAWALSLWESMGISATWVPRSSLDDPLVRHTWEPVPNQDDGAPWRIFRLLWNMPAGFETRMARLPH